MKEYMESFYKHVKDEFDEKDVEFFFENKCSHMCKVKLDCQEMNRVLLNIVENSVKYKGEKKVKVKITVTEKDDLINIELSDNGNGVEENELPNLFVSFYRGDVSRTNPSQGSGLGLAIAKNIVEAHGGKIEAYNVNGLTINIIIPKILDK
jgi:signal transduction histidine kinase